MENSYDELRPMTKDEIKDFYITLQEQRPDLLEKIFNDNSLGLTLLDRVELIRKEYKQYDERRKNEEVGGL